MLFCVRFCTLLFIVVSEVRLGEAVNGHEMLVRGVLENDQPPAITTIYTTLPGPGSWATEQPTPAPTQTPTQAPTNTPTISPTTAAPTSAPTTMLPYLLGRSVALFNPVLQKYLTVNNEKFVGLAGQEGSTKTHKERFLVVDVENNEIALHNAYYNVFVRLAGSTATSPYTVDASAKAWANAFPAAWGWEKLKLKVQSGNQVALWSQSNNRFIQLNSSTNKFDGTTEKGENDLPDDWTSSRFKVLDLGRPPSTDMSALIGQTVALYSLTANRYMLMNSTYKMGGSDVKFFYEPLASDWNSNILFTVVDAGNKAIALHSPTHNRFLRITSGGIVDGTGGDKAADQLPTGWNFERFKPKELGNGLVAIHCPDTTRFLKMSDTGVVDVFEKKFAELPKDEDSARFFVKVL